MEENNTNNISQQPIETKETPIEGVVFKEKDSKVGPVVGSVIVVLIIIVGGLYFWSNYVEQIKQEGETTEEQTVAEVEKIQNELEDINLDDINSELDAIDAEFDNL